MKVIAKNKKVEHDNEIIKKYEAGIVLTGAEIKSLRLQAPSLKGSFAYVRDSEIFLVNAHIPEYKFSSKYSLENSEPTRSRKLLLHKNEIRRINQIIKEQKLILLPLKIYWTSNSLVKVEIALAKPLKKYDLREKLKAESIKRDKW